MQNKWERRESKLKNRGATFKVNDCDFQEKASAKKLSKQRRAWAISQREMELDYVDDEYDT